MGTEDVFGGDFTALFEIGKLLRAEDLFELARGFAGLRTVSFIGDHGEATAGFAHQFAHLVVESGKSLDGADDDLLIAVEGFGKLATLAARVVPDSDHHARDALQIEDGIL